MYQKLNTSHKNLYELIQSTEPMGAVGCSLKQTQSVLRRLPELIFRLSILTTNMEQAFSAHHLHRPLYQL